METRCKMTLKQFKEIGQNEDPEYLTIEYEEALFENVRNNIYKSYESTYNSMTKGQLVFWEYSMLSSQVRNGGITQYFWNCEDYYMREFDFILETINDSTFTRLVNEAKGIYIENKYLVSNYRYLDSQPIKKLDYYSLWRDIMDGEVFNKYFFANSIKFEKIIYDYIVKNPKEFIK